MPGDRDLLEAWQGGDKAAGEALFERYYGVLVRFFANKIDGDPLDIIHETFLGCIGGLPRLQQSFRSYLFGIAYNQLKKHYERRRMDAERFDPATQSVADLSPGPGTMLAKGVEQRLLLDALRRIPMQHQVVLELFYWEELTSAEIGEALELPDGTVRTRLRRARVLLEQALRDAAADPRVLESTRSNLEGWVAKIRAAHGGRS
ncbi:MAG: sigma-70 family RNA polymerase sigma factor [Myxococcales bacterium]|nr:sigma-70 family RNA polymerase sigma factor [Myxococcales bacterium]